MNFLLIIFVFFIKGVYLLLLFVVILIYLFCFFLIFIVCGLCWFVLILEFNDGVWYVMNFLFMYIFFVFIGWLLFLLNLFVCVVSWVVCLCVIELFGF